jgi:flagellar assembly factor FliW
MQSWSVDEQRMHFRQGEKENSMKIKTRLFGEIDIQDEKIITLDKGIVGFPDLKKFTLIYDEEKGDDHDTIMWFQSIDEPQFAMPVVLPIVIKPDYNPTINDELLLPLGDLTEENTYVLVTIKVPSDPTQMSVNLKAPIIINTDTLKGGQLIVEDEEYEVRFPIYDILKKAKEEAGE